MEVLNITEHPSSVMVSVMKYACYVMMHDVMVKQTTGIADNIHGKGK